MSDTPAVRCAGTSRTADTVKQRAAHIAAGLGALGTQLGERVAVVFDPDLPREDSGKLFKRRIRERYLTDVPSRAFGCHGRSVPAFLRTASDHPP